MLQAPSARSMERLRQLSSTGMTAVGTGCHHDGEHYPSERTVTEGGGGHDTDTAVSRPQATTGYDEQVRTQGDWRDGKQQKGISIQKVQTDWERQERAVQKRS